MQNFHHEPMFITFEHGFFWSVFAMFCFFIFCVFLTDGEGWRGMVWHGVAVPLVL